MPRLITALMAAALLTISALSGAFAADTPVVRVGVLKFGTVNWELDTIKHHKLDAAKGIDLQIVELASGQATQVALQAGAVDMIVSDWLWVSRQRSEGGDFTFAPYSTAAGMVMVPADSPIRTLADLKGRKLGVAGGPLDKSWLMLRALAIQDHGFDPDKDSEKVFGAPPLLNEQVRGGGVDAVLNYWHFAARLKAAGLRPVISVEDITHRLGITTGMPITGYVFRDEWAGKNMAAIKGFLAASQAARSLMRDSDAEWQRLAPLMKAEDESTFLALRDGYRVGIPVTWGEAERNDAVKIYQILSRLGGRELVGDAKQLAPGTFWSGLAF